jgi:hypothetical protein
MYVRAALPGAAPVTNIIRPQGKLFSIQKVAQNGSASRFMSSILSAALRCWNADRDRCPEGAKGTRQSGFRATHSAVTLTNTKYREIVVTYTIETFCYLEDHIYRTNFSGCRQIQSASHLQQVPMVVDRKLPSRRVCCFHHRRLSTSRELAQRK